MADSAAIRTKRAKLHRAGDHSMCKPGRCPALLPTSPDDRTVPAGVEDALLDLAGALRVPRGDARAVIIASALKLARAMDAAEGRDTATIGRELRAYVSWAGEFEQEVSPVDEVRAARALRRVNLLLSTRDTGDGA